MILIRLWQKYLLKEFFSVFFLFLVCFYSLYVIIDYTNHSASFHHLQSRFPLLELGVYYACEFIKRSELLIPIAMVIALVRTLTKLNQQFELIALRAAGIPLMTLMRPFVLVGLAMTLLMYANEEWVMPAAMKKIKHIEDSRSQAKRQHLQAMAAQHVALEDNSTLIFQKYDSSRNHFFDVYWIQSPDVVFRMKSLEPYVDVPIGHFVDRLERSKEGALIPNASYDTLQFPGIKFNRESLLETLTPTDDLSISKLWVKIPPDGVIQSDKDAQAMGTLYRKIIMPWLCLFAIIGPAPFCIRFSRHMPVFMIFAMSVFGILSLYLIFDASHLLAKRQVLDPTTAILTPFVLFFILLGWRFAKMK